MAYGKAVGRKNMDFGGRTPIPFLLLY